MGQIPNKKFQITHKSLIPNCTTEFKNDIYNLKGQLWSDFNIYPKKSSNPNKNVPQKGVCRFRRSSKHKLALSSMSQKWTNHSIHSQIPPRNIDKHLHKFKIIH